jgi:hypothetical protein
LFSHYQVFLGMPGPPSSLPYLVCKQQRNTNMICWCQCGNTTNHWCLAVDTNTSGMSATCNIIGTVKELHHISVILHSAVMACWCVKTLNKSSISFTCWTMHPSVYKVHLTRQALLNGPDSSLDQWSKLNKHLCRHPVRIQKLVLIRSLPAILRPISINVWECTYSKWHSRIVICLTWMVVGYTPKYRSIWCLV